MENEAKTGRDRAAGEPRVDESSSEDEAKSPGAGSRTGRRSRKRAALSDGRIQLLTYQQPDGIKELKKLGIEQDRPVTDLVTEAINDLLQKYGRPPLA